MTDVNTLDKHAIVDRLAFQVEGGSIRITAYAHQAMVEESFVLDDIFSALRDAMS